MDNESIVKLIAKWRSRSQTFTNRAAANRYGRCADELEAAVRASPPPDEGIATQLEKLADYCEQVGWISTPHGLIPEVLREAAHTLRAVRDGRREGPAK